MLSRLLGRRNQEQHDFDHMVVEGYSFSGKAQDQFRSWKIVNAQMRNRDAVADVTETLLVTLDCLVTPLSGQTGDCGFFTEGVDNLREFALGGRKRSWWAEAVRRSRLSPRRRMSIKLASL